MLRDGDAASRRIGVKPNFEFSLPRAERRDRGSTTATNVLLAPAVFKALQG
jgi:hypothetical protein